MERKVVRYILIGQVGLFISLIICALLIRSQNVISDGISYFGVHRKTIIPYAAGIIFCSLSVIKATTYITIDSLQVLKRALQTVSVLLIGLLLTPYTINTFFNWAHMTVGTLIFLIEMAISIWIVIMTDRDYFYIVLFLIQFTSGVVALLSLIGTVNLLFYGQFIYQIAFAFLLYNALPRVLTAPAMNLTKSRHI